MHNRRGNVQKIGPLVLVFGVAVIMAAVIAAVVTGVGNGLNGASCVSGYTLSGSVGTYLCTNSSNASMPQHPAPIQTAALNATDQGLTGMTNISAQFPLLGTVIVFSIILAVVIGFLAMKRKNG